MRAPPWKTAIENNNTLELQKLRANETFSPWQELWASQRLGETISVLDICPHKRRHDVIPSIHVAEIVNRVLEVLVPSGHALIFAYLDRCFVVDSDDDGSGKWMT